jgi:protein TilB
MPEITRALLRKRAEHNEGIISTLEEISLHQEELESINEVLGSTCRKLKILYLQNNIIRKMENLVHLKDLQYLNLALNNIKKIEGLQNCEFLNKLDLTVNFVDVDTLEESIDHLASRKCLKDLYMMGNPAQANWEGFNHYLIAKLPQLHTLDGTDITRSMQIQARQKLPQLEVPRPRAALYSYIIFLF